MSDEQRSGMEPEASVRGRPFTEDEPAEDTEGHTFKFRPAIDGEQAGTESPEGSDDKDTEGHLASRKF